MAKKIDPPTEQECIDYAAKNNLLVDGHKFYKYYESTDWMYQDKKGMIVPVKLWKGKMWTWHNRAEEQSVVFKCSKCGKKPAPYISGCDRDGHPYHYCHLHKPQPKIAPEIKEMAKGIGVIPHGKEPEPAWKQRKKLITRSDNNKCGRL